MLTDEAVIGLLKESFDADTRTVAASPDLAGAVHLQLRRRRVGGLAAGGAAVVVASVAAAALVVGQHGQPTIAFWPSANSAPSAVASPSHATKTVKLSSFAFVVPAQATVTKTCLPGTAGSIHQGELFGFVTDDSGKLRLDAAGNPCIGATIEFTKNPPHATSEVTESGQRTVFIAPSAAGTRAGYVMLDGHESAGAALTVGGTPGRYVALMTIPADNDQSVLVAALRQYDPITN